MTNDEPRITNGDEAALRLSPWLYLPVLLAVCYFFVRGPINGMKDGHGGDFDVVYLATHAWMHGQNPYQHDNLLKAYQDTAVIGQRPADDRWLVALYPPSIYPVMAPLALLDRDTGKHAMISLNLLMTIVILWMLPGVAGVESSRTWTTLLRIAVLVLAPLHTTINMGQTSLLVGGCLVAAVWCRQRDRWVWSGVLLGLATAVKINLALPFVAYELLRGRWKPSLLGLGIAAGLFAIGVLPLQWHHPEWFGQFRDNMDALLRGGGFGDPTRLNETRHHLINLQYALHTLTDHRAVVSAITAAFVLTLALLTMWFVRCSTDRTRDLLGLGMVSVLALLLTYHRFYDAVLLVFPVAWAAAALESRKNRKPAQQKLAPKPCSHFPLSCFPAFLLLFCLPFIAPGAVVLENFARKGFIPASLHQSALWNVVVMPHQAWALLAMALLLLAALWTWPTTNTDTAAARRRQ